MQKCVYMYHSLVELIYEEIKRANWIVIRNDENTLTFFKVKMLTQISLKIFYY